jgi:glycosyltransferase involved in cell wall biosynthesis
MAARERIMNKVRVVILTSSFPRWANDTDPPFVFELARRISHTFDITVLAPHCDGAKRREDLNGIQVVRFAYAPYKYEKIAYAGGILGNLKKSPVLCALIPFFLAAELLNLIKLIIDLRPQIIHAHWVLPQALVAVLACKITKSPLKILCTAHGADIYGLKGACFKRLRRFVYRNLDRCTAVSNAMREDIRQEAGGDLTIDVMPMGVDLQGRFAPASRPPQKNQVLFVGRLVEKKGLTYLIKAFPAIRQAIPDASLLIIGDGPHRHQLETLARKLDVADQISFLGALPNQKIAWYYQQAEILVFPSIISADGDREGLGLVPIEAMGCGCAVVATDLPALADVIHGRINGISVPQRSPLAIAGAVVQLLKNRTLLARMRRKGREYVLGRFDWAIVAERYQSLMQDMVNK